MLISSVSVSCNLLVNVPVATLINTMTCLIVSCYATDFQLVSTQSDESNVVIIYLTWFIPLEDQETTLTHLHMNWMNTNTVNGELRFPVSNSSSVHGLQTYDL